MELQDLDLTDDFLGPQCLLDSSPSLSSCSVSPTNAASAPPRPALSPSSLLFGVSKLESPTGSNFSRGKARVTSNSISAQVDSLMRGDMVTRTGVVGSKWLCLVCGDFASGFHYSVVSCEACKAFFKRTIQGNINYSCPVMNKCEVTKRRRKACQACRFQKCLQVGMMREGVRLDRVRGGRQKYRKRVEVGLGFNGKASHSYLMGSRNKLISHLLLTDSPPLAANQDESVNDSLCTLVTLCELLNRELLLLIGWAKQIPGFSALSLVDQMALLQRGWMEALLVGMAWRSQGAQGEELVFATNLRLDANQCQAAGLAELHEALCHLTCKYQAMNLSAEEAVTLKAMALANSDAEPLECPDEVQELQDRLHDALQEYELSSNEQRRTGRLLMSLPLLRQTAKRAVQTLLRLCRQHHIPLHKLLLEMLDNKP